MSRNFELLQKVQSEHGDGNVLGVSAQAAALAPISAARHAPRLPTGGLAREEIERLVQRLFLLETEERPCVVAFCPVEGGNDGSAISARVAEYLAAKVSGSVCLVDANIQVPVLHEYFGYPNESGFCEFLQDESSPQKLVREFDHSNFSLLTAGSAEGYSALGLTPERLRSRLALLRRVYSYVVIATSPISSSSIVLPLAQVSDGCVLVVRSDVTRREAARKAKQELESANVRVLGTVLTDRTYPIPESLYSRL